MRKIVISAIIVFLNTINLRFQIYCIILVCSRAETFSLLSRCFEPGAWHLLLRDGVVAPIRHTPGALDGAHVSLICAYATGCLHENLTRRRSLATLLFTCMCGLMMNDVLRIDTASSPAASTLTKEDEMKNNIFGIVTLILNLLALLFILYTVAPEYRFVKRLIAAIRMVRLLL